MALSKFEQIIAGNYTQAEMDSARLREVRAYAGEVSGGDPGKFKAAFTKAVQLLRKASNEIRNP